MIINLPCNIVTFQKDVRIIYTILKYKTVADIKEVIGKSYVYTYYLIWSFITIVGGGGQ